LTQPALALVGLSGVGKSTLLRAVSEHIQFQHLQASALIKAAREALAAAPVATDDLRRADINDNQMLLIEGFKDARSPDASLVVLDGHTVVDTPSGLVKIAPEVFGALGISDFVFIAEDAEVIFQRRRADQTRNRPDRSPEELDEQQTQALLAAFQAARMLCVPLHVLSTTHVAQLSHNMANLLRT
jgi:adenylate kinase